MGRTGIEPVTSCLSSKRSPAELTPLQRRMSLLGAHPRGRALHPGAVGSESINPTGWGSARFGWRRRAESNRCAGLCRPLPKPLGHAAVNSLTRQDNRPDLRLFLPTAPQPP